MRSELLLKSSVARIVPHCLSSVSKVFSRDKIKLLLDMFKLVVVNAVRQIADDMTIILLLERSSSWTYFTRIIAFGPRSVKLFELKSMRPKEPIRCRSPTFSKLFP